MLPITLCILIASGYERGEIPAVQAERLDLLLASIRRGYDNPSTRILVTDDYSGNKRAQQDCSDVCKRYETDYLVKPAPWTGPSGNYNFAVQQCDTEYIAMLGDDQYCTPGWWQHMLYFIGHNPNLNWGMLGWSVIFAEDLVRVGFLPHKEAFYTENQRLHQLTVHNLPREAISGVWCNWDKPRYRGCCSGTAFVIRKSLWYGMDGFYEKIFQFDEDYGDNIWNTTDKTCIQIPTPPILHYGGACCWPPECGAGDPRWRAGWETRPFVPVRFEDRGKRAAELIVGQPEGVAFLPLPFTQEQKGLILDLGCGKNIRNKGAIGIDLVGKPITDAEVVCNLGFDPLPFLDNSCKQVVAHDILEHIPHTLWITTSKGMKRITPTIHLFNEVWRVLEDGGLFETAIPIYPNGEAFQDPTHASVWTADSFNYFADTYHGFKEAYGHTSTFKKVRQFIDGAHLHTLLQAVKS